MKYHLLDKLTEAGFRFRIKDHTKLEAATPKAADPALIAQMAAHKSELVAAIQDGCPVCGALLKVTDNSIPDRAYYECPGNPCHFALIDIEGELWIEPAEMLARIRRIRESAEIVPI
jgi:hypothetical protein